MEKQSTVTWAQEQATSKFTVVWLHLNHRHLNYSQFRGGRRRILGVGGFHAVITAFFKT